MGLNDLDIAVCLQYCICYIMQSLTETNLSLLLKALHPLLLLASCSVTLL